MSLKIPGAGKDPDPKPPARHQQQDPGKPASEVTEEVQKQNEAAEPKGATGDHHEDEKPEEVKKYEEALKAIGVGTQKLVDSGLPHDRAMGIAVDLWKTMNCPHEKK